MKIPSGLVIQDEKITKYLLVYQPKSDKSIYLALAGYNLDNWKLLKNDIINAVEGSEIAKVTPNDWGTQFEVKSEWSGPNSRLIKVITIWQQDEETEFVRFITLYPDKSQET
ncbi:MAG: DUF6883 domain-containing protein [Nostoc sp.]|uniref:DUF6883 domain-containing protein n=1 Tax=Nostoc sp. TaxID=1180 RepID=UPI002FF59529